MANNLYKITWDSNIAIIDFYSPQFLEAPGELQALSKFVKLFEERKTKILPKNIEIIEICDLDKIIKY